MVRRKHTSRDSALTRRPHADRFTQQLLLAPRLLQPLPLLLRPSRSLSPPLRPPLPPRPPLRLLPPRPLQLLPLSRPPRRPLRLTPLRSLPLPSRPPLLLRPLPPKRRRRSRRLLLLRFRPRPPKAYKPTTSRQPSIRQRTRRDDGPMDGGVEGGRWRSASPSFFCWDEGGARDALNCRVAKLQGCRRDMGT